MIYNIIEPMTEAYLWNTTLPIHLSKNTKLSDYTGLDEEFDRETLDQTYKKVCKENEVNMISPALMMVTTGEHKSLRVWIDHSFLNPLPAFKDPLKGYEYYSGE
jgi:hypothetical protein